MSVLPEARGHGVAGGLTTMRLRQAKAVGCTHAVLGATDMAVGVYSREGFAESVIFSSCQERTREFVWA